MAEFVEVMRKKQSICTYYDHCIGIGCPIYMVGSQNSYSCVEFCNKFPEEAEKLIMSWETPVDWSKVPVDTKILVRDNTAMPWIKRYFDDRLLSLSAYANLIAYVDNLLKTQK